MKNRKKIPIAAIMIMVVLVGIVLIFSQVKKSNDNKNEETDSQEIPQSVPFIEDAPALEPADMAGYVGEVVGIEGDNLTVKTEEEEISFNISSVPVYSFTESGAEKRSVSDIGAGSEVSIQADSGMKVFSIYIIKK